MQANDNAEGEFLERHMMYIQVEDNDEAVNLYQAEQPVRSLIVMVEVDGRETDGD